MAKVREIQSCGGKISLRLMDACFDYLEDVIDGTDRSKLNFSIETDSGDIKHITFCQEDNGIHVYGDFEGMPNFLEWAQLHVNNGG